MTNDKGQMTKEKRPMPNDQGRTTDRREFFSALARGVVLGVLGAGAFALATRPEDPAADPTAQSCDRSGLCRGCPAVRQCGLPQALSAKAGGRNG